MRSWALVIPLVFSFVPKLEAQLPLQTPAYHFGSSVRVGAAAVSGVVTVTLSAAGSVGSISVLTQGVTNQDYTATTGGSCVVGTSYTAGQSCTVAVNFQPIYPGLRQGAVVLTTSGGSVIGTELLNATGIGPTAIFVPGILTTVAGNGQWIYRGDGGPATQSSLFLPMGGAADAAGNLLLTDSNNQRIRMVSAATGLISTIAGDGVAGFAGDGGPATSAMLDTPADVKLNGAGDLIIADSSNHAIRMVNRATGLIWTIAGIGGASGYSGDGGQATQAHLAYPSGIAFDGDHLLYISDTGNNAVRKVDLSTGIITTVAGNGTAGFLGDGGPAVAGELNYPWGIALGGDGSLYIADLSNNRIRKVSTAGVISTVVGTGSRAYGGDGGPATQAMLNVPAAVGVDVAGNLYVADSGNDLVRKVSATTGIIQTIAGVQGGVTGNGIPANTVQLDGPYAVFFDGPGNVYIADMFNQLIRMVSSNSASLTYPPMRVGGLSTPQSETLEDDGNAALNFSAFNLVSNSALDAGTTTCSLTQAVGVDGTCVLGVEFAPTVTGNPVTGSISVASNAANGPNLINLSGQVLSVNPTQITLTSSANPAAKGAAVTFTALVTSSGSTGLTGSVNFLDGTTQIGNGTLNGSGAATFTVSTLTTGTHSITAVYSGDTNDAAATSAVLKEVIKQSTTTTLTSTPNPSMGGVLVTFTATVQGPNGSTAIPGGTVTFSDGATAIGSGTLNASGVATFSIATLSGGQHNITASYGGDGSDLASQSVVLVQTVALATTATSLSTSNATVYVGVSVTFTSVVSRTDGMIPTGSVTFLDGTTVLGKGTLNGAATATLSTSALAAGTHLISAVYGGDANDQTSTSAVVTQTVQQVGSATVLTSNANPGVAGATLVLTATVSQSGTTGAGGAFTGTVTFKNGTTTLGVATVSAAGVATLSVSTLAIGANAITAIYAGNTNYGGSTSTALIETISAAATSTLLVTSGTPSIAGKPVTFSITVSGSGGMPTGVVTLLDGSGATAVTLGTATLSAKGTTSLTITNLAVGQHPLTATYGGDGNDTGSSSAVLIQTVQLATSTTMLSSNANPSGSGAAVIFTATVAGNGSTPTGSITFSDGSTVLGVAPINAGVATLTTSTLALGTHSITAVYGGDTNNGASQSAALAQQVLQTGGMTLASSANPSLSGASVTFSATVAAAQGLAVTGSVTFKEGTTTLGVSPLAAGAAAFSTAALAVGQHSILAVYGGDSNNLPQTTTVLVQTVQLAGTSVTLSSGTNPSIAGVPVTLTSTVAGKGAAATGTVTFVDGTTTLGTASVNGNGVATYIAASLAPGQHSIVANYGGDGNNSASSSPVLLQTVMQSTSVALSSGQNPSLVLDGVTFTSKVTNSGGIPPSGTVVFTDGTTVLGKATLDGTGTATLTATLSTTGKHAISAAYGGDLLDTAAVSAGLTQTVQLRPTTDTLTASSTSLSSAQQVTLISVVRFSGPVTPTGTVTFTNNGTVLGTVTVDATGVATLTINPLGDAPSLMASYSGDSVYSPSSSQQTDLTVAQEAQFTIQMSPSSISLQSKQHITSTVTLTSLNNFSDTLDLGCLGLPFAATCTFTKDTVALGGNGVQVLQVVVDTGSPLTSGPVASVQQHSKTPLTALCLLPGGALFGLLLLKGGRRGRRLSGLLMVLLLAGATSGLTGCGGLQQNATPAGTYVFQMTATGTSTGATQLVNVSLTVTP